MASSFRRVVAAVGPDETVPAPEVVPEAWPPGLSRLVRRGRHPAVLHRAIAAEAAEENFAVTVGLFPAPAVIGAVQTLCCVLSGPTNC